MNNRLLFRSLSEKKKTIFLYSHNNSGLFIWHGAIDSCILQNIDLGYFLSYGNAEIFAPCCFELHNVTWRTFSHDTHKHIPPSSLLGKDYHGRHIHIALMKAFSYQYSYFYCQEIIDEIFRKVAGVEHILTLTFLREHFSVLEYAAHVTDDLFGRIDYAKVRI